MNKKCNICNSSTNKLIFSYDKPDNYEMTFLKKNSDIKRFWFECLHCGNFFSKADYKINLQKFYRKNYRSKKNNFRKNSAKNIFERIISLPEKESECSERLNRIKKFVNNFFSDSSIFSKVLDVGGASGVFAYKLLKVSDDVSIIDLSDQGNFIEEYGIKYIQSSYEKHNGKNYSLVTANFVMEHLDEPNKFLKYLFRYLKKDGLLYIEVPSSISFKKFSKSHDTFNSTHKFIFDKKYLHTFFTNNKFEIKKIEEGKNLRGYYFLAIYCMKK